MDHVQNLGKMLIKLVKKISKEKYFPSIKQKVKQILKRPDNSSTTMSSQSHLTTEPPCTTIATSSQGTSEKIIMETQTEDIVSGIREWALERIDNTNHEYAQALYEEFAEWIDLDGVEDVEIMSLELNERD